MSPRPFLGLLLVLAFSFCVRAQNSLSDSDRIKAVRQLFAEERWHEIVGLVETEPIRSADMDYYYGTALAKLERWDDAGTVFRHGLLQQPRDKRFPIELAGVSFKQGRFSEAADYLHDALRLDPSDSYANDFLASIYYLESNLEASLKYWNRVGKPDVVEVRLEPTPKVDAVLLDRAFSFAPASKLALHQFRTTEARLRALNIFSKHRFDLQARPDGRFDMVLRANERSGLESGKWQSLLGLLRGLPFQSIHPEVFNINGRAVNFISMIRWDSDKQRIWASLSGPFGRDPKWLYGLDIDLRREDWDIRDSFTDRSQSFGELKLRKQAVRAEVSSFASGRWSWSTGVEASHRGYQRVNAGAALAPELLLEGFQLKHLGIMKYDLVRVPEERFVVTTGGSTEIARIWSGPSHAFARIQASVHTHWFPQPRGDDYQMLFRVHGGRTFGKMPFDELFVLGVERDNDLLLRAHIGTHRGRKGSAPLGRNYFLANWEIDKNVYSNGMVTVKLGPFLDSGKITDPSGGLGSRKWLWDLGAQTKVRVLGVGLAFSYGKDLRSGNNAFYVSTSR